MTKWIKCDVQKPKERTCVIGNSGSCVWNPCYFGAASLIVGATESEKIEKRPDEKLWRNALNDVPLPFRVVRWTPIPRNPYPPLDSKDDALIMQDANSTRIY